MAIADYIDKLKKTKTFQAGLINCQEYSMKSEFFGFKRTLPDIPHADDDRHVIVMEVRGDQPNIYAVLAKQNHSISLTARDADNFLFIFIEMRPQTFKVETPIEGYHLSDGHRISATLTIIFQVTDAEIFWKGSRDQLTDLENSVIDATKNFFLNITSNYLINSPSELKQSLEQHLQKTEIIIIKNDLEANIYKNCDIAGINLIKVKADVFLSDSLKEHLQRMHTRLYGDGGLADRSKIDKLIDFDQTYRPYGLRQVIMALDIRLLENFYKMNWGDAMGKVTERLAERKEMELNSVGDTEISNMQKIINASKSLGLGDIAVIEIKDKIHKKLMDIADRTSEVKPPSDIDYLMGIVGPPSSTALLTSDNTDQIVSGDEKKNE